MINWQKSMKRLIGLIAVATSICVLNSHPINTHAATVNKLQTMSPKEMKKNQLKVLSTDDDDITVNAYGGAKFQKKTITETSEVTGWPYNQSTGIYTKTYEANKNLHSKNVAQHMGNGGRVYKVTLPKYNPGSSKISVHYNDAVEYNGKTYDVTLTIGNFSYYPPNLWSTSSVKPDVYISPNFKNGIWYDGIISAQAQWTIEGINWDKDKKAYISFNSLNGVSYDSNQADSDDVDGKGINSFRNNAFFFRYSSMSMNNYLKATQPNGIKHTDKWYDQTGKFVNWDNGDIAYTYSRGKYKSAIIKYTSKINGLFRGQGSSSTVIGGKPGSIYTNNKSSEDFDTHSVLYDITGKGATQTFTFGSGEGYGNFTITSRTYKYRIPNPTPNPTGTPTLNKTASKARIHKSGEGYTYTIKGYYPERHYTETQYISGWNNYTVNVGTHKKPKYEHRREPIYSKKETNTGDYWTFTDKVPDSLTIESVSTDNISISQNGNTLTASYNYQGMKNKNNQTFTIKIKVKANNLPQPGSDGWHDDGPSQYGMYYIKNQAQTNYQVYSQPGSYKSNPVKVGIERWRATLHHYDFDFNNSGDFSGFNIDWQGDNFQNSTGYTNDLKTQYVYGYENETKPINAINGLTDGQGHTYTPFVQSGTVKFPTLDTGEGDDAEAKGPYKDDPSGGEDDEDMQTDFYMPYYLVKLQSINNMVKIDTDKASSGLPIHIYQRNESYLFKNISQYAGLVEHVTVNEVLDNGQVVSTPAFQTSRSVTDMISSAQHGGYWWNIDGTLKNLVNPKDGTSTPDKGQKINFQVNISYDNPNNVDLILSGNSMKTYGFISTEGVINNDAFKKQNFVAWNPVERTIAYNGASQIRELREGIRVDQERKASAKTGYGMKSDFKLEYAGWSNVNGLSVTDIMNSAAGLNYVFPKAFAPNGNEHDPSAVTKDKNSGFKDSDSAINYNKYNNLNPLSDDLDGSSTNNFLQDRLEQVNIFDNSGKYAPNMAQYSNPATLDTFNNDSAANRAAMQNAQMISTDDYDVNQFAEQVGSFNTEYRFYDRIANFGANLPNGVIGLASSVQDPEAWNKVQFDALNTDAGYRFYTPYWLSLKTDTKDGYWPTYWEKSTDKRFGANFFNINDRRPINFYGHMYLANNSKSDQNDELSLQPLMTAKQIPNGFSQSQVDWLKHYAVFK